MESLETVDFIKWPVKPEQLKKFSADRQNLKVIDIKQLFLLTELEELPGDSWTKIARYLHKHMRKLESPKLSSLTTHYASSTEPDFVPNETAERVCITWLTDNHQKMLCQIACHGSSVAMLQRSSKVSTENTFCRLELPLKRFGWVAPKIDSSNLIY